MTERMQVYKCEICGNMVEVLHAGAGVLVCCGQPMDLFDENTVDAATEKHVPIIEEVEGGILVKVGEVPHPMEETHFIEWIQVIQDGTVYRKFLSPGEKPEAFFKAISGDVTAREYCNLHGIWRS